MGTVGVSVAANISAAAQAPDNGHSLRTRRLWPRRTTFRAVSVQLVAPSATNCTEITTYGR
ncbi:hypothetical protein AU196_05665 [Mycobacterium sp. IS-1742]|nr:hypothetical protein AU196_05665 [Mycobacterium sp. IS-1742]